MTPEQKEAVKKTMQAINEAVRSGSIVAIDKVIKMLKKANKNGALDDLIAFLEKKKAELDFWLHMHLM